jgi:hypothetical protein
VAVRAVDPLDDARLRLTFLDGTSGDVHLRQFLDSDRVSGTVFEPLRNPAIFGRCGSSCFAPEPAPHGMSRRPRLPGLEP